MVPTPPVRTRPALFLLGLCLGAFFAPAHPVFGRDGDGAAASAPAPAYGAFRVCSLASGSGGNAYYAENEDGAILIDAGISLKRLRENLLRAGGRLEKVVAVLITHGHGDHVKAAGVWQREYGAWRFLMTAEALREAQAKTSVRPPREPEFLEAGRDFEIGGFRVECLAVPHDAAGTVGFVLERAGRRCGVFTDVGAPFDGLGALLSTLDGLFIAGDYSDEILDRRLACAMAPPARGLLYQTRRLRSGLGHLSNRQVGELLRDHAGDKLRGVVLTHLSADNNAPEQALAEVRALAGGKLDASGAVLAAAPPKDPGPWLAF